MLEGFLAESKLAPSRKLMLRNAIVSFYKHNRRALDSQVASNIKDEQPESIKRHPSLDDLCALTDECHTARDKALLWFLESSGVRVGTLNKLKWRDLKPTQNIKVPYYLEIDSKRLKGAGKGKYRGLKQTTFMHHYAYEKLLAYKKEAKLKGYQLNDDAPLFIAYYAEGKNRALTEKGINQIFETLSLETWGDLEVKRFSPHDLRETLQSALEQKLSENFI